MSFYVLLELIVCTNTSFIEIKYIFSTDRDLAGLPLNPRLLRSALLSRTSSDHQHQQHQNLPCQSHQSTSRTLQGNWRIFTILSPGVPLLSARRRPRISRSAWHF